MDDAISALQWAVAGAFTLVGALSLRDYARHRGRSRAALSVALLLLGAVEILGRAEALMGHQPRPLQALGIAAFLGSGYALLSFRDTFVPFRPLTRRLVTGGVVAVGLAAMLTPFPQGTHPKLSPAQYGIAVGFIVTWMLCVGEPSARLWLASRGRPAVQRARLRALSTGYGTMVLILLVAINIGSTAAADKRFTLATTAVALLITPLLYVGFAPPGWLRRVWRHGEEEAFRTAMNELLLFSPDRQTLAQRAVEWAVRLVGGEGGAIYDSDGELLALDSLDARQAAELEESIGARHGGRRVVPVPMGRTTRYAVVLPVNAPGGAETMVVLSGAFTPLFGSDETALLGQYAASIATALDRARLVDALTRQTRRYEAVLNAMSDLGEGFLIVEGRRLAYANDAFASMLGYRVDELLELPTLAALAMPEDRGRMRRDLDDRLAGRPMPEHVERRLEGKDGRPVDVELALKVITVQDRVQVVGMVRDITERRRTEQRLRESEARRSSILGNAPIVFFGFDREGVITLAEGRGLDALGVRSEQLVGRSIFSVYRDSAAVTDVAQRALSGEEISEPIEVAGVALDTWLHPVRDEDGQITHVIGVTTDITERVHAEEALRHRVAQQAAVAALGQRALTGSDLSGLMDDAAGVVAQMLGVSRTAVVEFLPDGRDPVVRAGTGWTRAVVGAPLAGGGDGSQAAYTLRTGVPVVVDDYATEGRFVAGELAAAEGLVSGASVLIQGHDRPFGVVQVAQTRKRSFSGDDLHFLQAVANVLAGAIERRHSEEDIRHQALHDPLTGLPNRSLFNDRLAMALDRSRRRGSRVALLFLDLDRFKVVNDSLGHDTGDQLLLEVAQRLREALRPADTVARFGGDEFVILCEDMDEHEAAHVADRLAESVAEPVQMGARTIYVSASIGVALTAPGEERAEDLLRDADVAMYRAKERGRARFEIFDQDMRAQAVHRLDTENSLRLALEREQFHLLYQPLVSLDDEKLVGVEALVRWEQPGRGVIGPRDFIPLAEETGLIDALGGWVIEEACRQAALWITVQPQSRFTIAVNVSARQIARTDLVAVVADALGKNALPPSMLSLEITESAVMEDVPRALSTLWRLRELGCNLVIDDFGTGFSSLSYLKQFPIANSVKIDKSFVDGLGQTVDDTAIVRAVVTMAHTLGLHTVAEGVEHGEQVLELRNLGCDMAQGYWFGVPVPAAVITDMLTPGSTPHHGDARVLPADGGRPVRAGAMGRPGRRH